MPAYLSREEWTLIPRCGLLTTRSNQLLGFSELEDQYQNIIMGLLRPKEHRPSICTRCVGYTGGCSLIRCPRTPERLEFDQTWLARNVSNSFERQHLPDMLTPSRMSSSCWPKNRVRSWFTLLSLSHTYKEYINFSFIPKAVHSIKQYLPGNGSFITSNCPGLLK